MSMEISLRRYVKKHFNLHFKLNILKASRVNLNFYYCDFWRTFSCRPTSLSLFYSMISCEGELRNGKKYAEMAYFMTISGNSGVHKRMACPEAESKDFPTYIPTILFQRW